MNLDNIIKLLKDNNIDFDIYDPNSLIIYFKHLDYYYLLDKLFNDNDINYHIIKTGSKSMLYGFN